MPTAVVVHGLAALRKSLALLDSSCGWLMDPDQQESCTSRCSAHRIHHSVLLQCPLRLYQSL